MNLALLGDELKPDRVVTAEDLTRDRLAFPAFYGDDMLLPEGKTPAYLGHAVATPDLSRLRALPYAKDKLRSLGDVVRGGAADRPARTRSLGRRFAIVRVGGATPYGRRSSSRR